MIYNCLSAVTYFLLSTFFPGTIRSLHESREVLVFCIPADTTLTEGAVGNKK